VYRNVVGGGGQDQGTFFIDVEVRDVRSRPISGAFVNWYNNIQIVDRKSTHNNGRVCLSSGGNISQYHYVNNNLKVEASGYSVGRLGNVGFDRGGRRLSVRFNLVPN